MSIIFDALKKVGKTGVKKEENSPVKKPKIPVLLYLTCAIGIAAGVFAAKTIFKFLTPSPEAPQEKIKAPVELPKNVTAIPLPNKPVIPEEIVAPKSPPVLKSEGLKDGAEALPALVLSGVFSSGDESFALINNRIVKVGDVIGGATLMKIGLEEVELEVNGLPLKLKTK